MKKSIVTGAAAAALLLGVVAIAQKPIDDVSAKRHPNLAAAQRLTQQAWEKLGAAQAANEFDMTGHGAKAKDLLDQANQQIKLAAEAANANKK